MEIETLNKIFLPWFLFLVYFCLACLFIHQGKVYPKTEAKTSSPTIIQPGASGENSLKNATRTKSYSPRLYLQVSEFIDRLHQSEIEQLCQNLGIEVKSKKEESLFLQKASIKRLFRESPKKVIAALKSSPKFN